MRWPGSRTTTLSLSSKSVTTRASWSTWRFHFFLYPSEKFKIILSFPEEEQLSHRLGPGSRLDYSYVCIFLFHLRVRCSCSLITKTMPLPGTGWSQTRGWETTDVTLWELPPSISASPVLRVSGLQTMMQTSDLKILIYKDRNKSLIPVHIALFRII